MKTDGWRERLILGEHKGTNKDKRVRVQMAIDGMVEKVNNVFGIRCWLFCHAFDGWGGRCTHRGSPFCPTNLFRTHLLSE